MHSEGNRKNVLLLIIVMIDNGRNPLPLPHLLPIFAYNPLHGLHALLIQFWLILHICYPEVQLVSLLSPRDTEGEPVSVVVFRGIRSLVLGNEDVEDIWSLLDIFQISSVEARRDCAVFKRPCDMLRIESPTGWLHQLDAAGLYFEEFHFIRVGHGLPLLV